MNTKLGIRSIAAILAVLTAAACLPLAGSPADEEKDVTLLIRLKAKGTDTPIPNATIYVKFKEKLRFRRDRKREWSLKSNPEGEVTFPQLPEGRALIQVVAEGWRSYGKFHELEGRKVELEIELERPPKWF